MNMGVLKCTRGVDSDDKIEGQFVGVLCNENGKNRSENYVMFSAIFASLISVLLGYDIGVMTGAILFIKENLKISEFQEEVLVGILSIVSLVGSLAGGKTSDAMGRKWTMAFATIVFQIGVAVMALAPSFLILMLGRIMAGIGIGIGVMITPTYIAEISPASARGTLTSFPEIFINLGILLGYISNYAFSGFPEDKNWRIMLAVGIVPSIFIGFALLVIPESPRWLVMQNKMSQAKLVLVKTNKSSEEAEKRLAEIQVAAGLTSTEKYDGTMVWRELLHPSPGVKRMLITGCGIQILQQITGIDATVYYSPTIFKDAGINSNEALLAATVAVGFSKTIFILTAIFLIDKVGRKPLLYVSTIGMTACLFILGFALCMPGDDPVRLNLAIFCACGNVAFFSVGIGPICWVLTSEIFPLRLRAQASAIVAVANRVSSGLVAMSFLTVSRAITVGGTFFIFAAISCLSVIFIHKYVPETKGKSLEQIEMLFHYDKHSKGFEVERGDVDLLTQNP
ncbi:OLC1v1021592C1 [Oldenlandia corymbosa var. corymbosa]|uniref:OLC1v1021592C1 n=1 Tax=Oldenlandia corymbosa var. corymbosa TaxID=529605 RepID=A0AAV1BXB5_OLDCO|nr:OLC1v1021592C1 [Oldenlandia corymbosa var. corymbosa]